MTQDAECAQQPAYADWAEGLGTAARRLVDVALEQVSEERRDEVRCVWLDWIHAQFDRDLEGAPRLLHAIALQLEARTGLSSEQRAQAMLVAEDLHDLCKPPTPHASGHGPTALDDDLLQQRESLDADAPDSLEDYTAWTRHLVDEDLFLRSLTQMGHCTPDQRLAVLTLLTERAVLRPMLEAGALPGAEEHAAAWIDRHLHRRMSEGLAVDRVSGSLLESLRLLHGRIFLLSRCLRAIGALDLADLLDRDVFDFMARLDRGLGSRFKPVNGPYLLTMPEWSWPLRKGVVH